MTNKSSLEAATGAGAEAWAVDVDDPSSVERWLAEQVAARVELPVSQIDVNQPFSCFAIDSVAALELMEGLEIALDYVVSPAIFYQQPATIRALAARLVASRGDQGSEMLMIQGFGVV